MSLLVDMTANALDPAYGEAAARRLTAERAGRSGTGHEGRASGSGRAVVAVVLVLAGLVTGVASTQVRQRAGEASATRRALVDDVRRQTVASDRLALQALHLREQVAAIRDRELGDDLQGRSAAQQVAALELATGGVAVRGPGLVVTLDDAPATPSGPSATNPARGGQLGDGRIYDRDLQDVVNALWRAGAEAIAINGQRLTATTAIRSAGEAVLVDFRPLSPPYVVRAVGDVDTLEPAFVDSATARQFQTWTSLYGLGFAVARSKELRLPAGGPAQLRLARPGGIP